MMKLNRRQRKAVLKGLGVVALMALFPPVLVYAGSTGFGVRYDRTHRFILQRYHRIRFETLFKRMFVVGVATAGVVVFRKGKDDDPKASPSDGG